MSSGKDCSSNFIDAVNQAVSDKSPLRLIGGGSKQQIIGREIEAKPLSLSDHKGIIDYQPSELVITARAGTTIAELQQTLAKQGQYLDCEPPNFSGKATLGGTLACNLSGPGRPWMGSVRDKILGLKLINGQGQHLSYGGQVMKNVAGYDVSRFQAGALGTLGIITEVSLKVMPKPQASCTLCYEMPAEQALKTMTEKSVTTHPLTAAAWIEGKLYLRLSGSRAAVETAQATWGGELCDSHVWQQLNEFSLDCFNSEQALWRLSTKPTAPLSSKIQASVIDWGGAQRWIQGDYKEEDMQSIAEQAGGHANLFKGGNREGETKQRLNAVEKTLHKRLKKAFDPGNIFNPGRMYSWL